MSDLPPPPPEFEPESSSVPPPPPAGAQIPNPSYANEPTRTYGPMFALAFFFPIHFFFLNRIALGVVYWVVAIVCGITVILIPIPLIWWFVNLFLVKGWVEKHNAAVLAERQGNA